MKTRFRLFRRANGIFYCQDTKTGRQQSLGTKDRSEGERLAHAQNEAHLQLSLNLHIARAYLMTADAPDDEISGIP